MGLSPTEKIKVLAAVRDLQSLEERVDAIENMINSFEDVQKAVRRAEAEAKKKAKAEEDKRLKLEEEAREEAALKKAFAADAELEKVTEKARLARVAAGLETPKKKED